MIPSVLLHAVCVSWWLHFSVCVFDSCVYLTYFLIKSSLRLQSLLSDMGVAHYALRKRILATMPY